LSCIAHIKWENDNYLSLATYATDTLAYEHATRD